MKFTVPRATLLDALAYLAKAAPTRPSLPILTGVVIDASDGHVVMSTFDYEQCRRYTFGDATDVTDGRALVSVHRLHAIVKDLPKGKTAPPVTIGQAGVDVTLTSGRSTFTVPTFPLEDYPTLPDMPTDVGGCDVQAFATAVKAVAASAGRDETLPMMTGVRVEASKGQITFMATDRYRLHVWDLPWTGGEFTALVPAATLVDAVKRAKVKAGVFTLAHKPGGNFTDGFGFTCGPYAYWTRVLDGGEYPPVRSLFPDGWTCEVDVDAADLLGAVKAVDSTLERTAPVLLTLAPGTTMRVWGGGDATGSETVDCAFRVMGEKDRDGAIAAMCTEQRRLVDGAREGLARVEQAEDGDSSAVEDARQRVASAEEGLAEARCKAGEVFDGRAAGLTVAFNPAYLSDAVSCLGVKRVRLCVVNRYTPSIVVGLDDDGRVIDGRRHLVMQIRVGVVEPRKDDDVQASDAPAAVEPAVGESAAPVPVSAVNAQTITDPVDLARVHVAVETHAGVYARNPLIRGVKADVVRYIADSNLESLCERYSRAQVWAAVERVVEERPELLEWSDYQIAEAQAAREAEAATISGDALRAMKAGDWAKSLDLLRRGELALPDWCTPNGYTWDMCRNGVLAKRDGTGSPADVEPQVEAPRGPGYPSVAKVPVLPDGYAERVERLRPYLVNGHQFSRGASEGVMYAVMKLEAGGDWEVDMTEAEAAAGLRDRSDVGRARRGEPLGPVGGGSDGGDAGVVVAQPVTESAGGDVYADLAALPLPAAVIDAVMRAIEVAAAAHDGLVGEDGAPGVDNGVRSFPIPFGTSVRGVVRAVRVALGGGCEVQPVRTAPGVPNEVRVTGVGVDWGHVAGVVTAAVVGLARV